MRYIEIILKIHTIEDISVLYFTEKLSSGNYTYSIYAIYGSETSEKVSINVSIKENISTSSDNHYPFLGRVGINTEKPNATLEIYKNELLPLYSPQGVLFPNFSSVERAKFNNIEEGTMIYNTTKNV